MVADISGGHTMPPNAVVNDTTAVEMGTLTEYADSLQDGTIKLVPKISEFAAKDFRPVKALGNGDMGSVYLVSKRNDNSPYAMKVMNKEVLLSRKNGRRAQAEKDILSVVNHPFLPVLHSHFEDDKHQFLIMDYCHGGDLNVLRQRQPEKRFSESACRFYIAEVILALEYLHKRKIVYRDLKPENILIQCDGHVMLTDFDLSLDLSERKWTKPQKNGKGKDAPSLQSLAKNKKQPSRMGSNVKALFACASPMTLDKLSSNSKKSPNSRILPEETFTGNKKRGAGLEKQLSGPANSFVGTEEYVAPEVIWGKGHGLPVDWWTLGVLLYELYYGKTPFKGVNRKETFYSILCKPVNCAGQSSPLINLIQSLLAKEPEERLGTNGGAEEIKKHPFFNGVNWDNLQNLSRTPVVPEPFSWEQIEKDLSAKAKTSGKPVQTKWSFFEPLDREEEIKTSFKSSPQGPLSLKSNTSSSFQDRMADNLLTQHLMRRESRASISRDYSMDGGSCDETFVLERQTEMYKQLRSTVQQQNSDNSLPEQKLFDDTF